MRALFLATGLAALSAVPAVAGRIGEPIRVYQTILCDTREAMEAIRDAAVAGGWAAARPVFQAMVAARNEYGEPVCGTINTPIAVMPVANVGDPVVVEGTEQHIWAILWAHVERGEQPGYVLMPEALEPAAPQGTAL